MKTVNKSTGFTLIELMVVIAIIALLSSVVLASLKGARERSILIKTVSEMKSLQTALELYRNQFGVYPGVVSGAFYTDDDSQNMWTSDDTLDNIFSILVSNKFIKKIPHAPNYPNNCVEVVNCEAKGYFLGYMSGDVFLNYYGPNSYSTCGRKKINNYALVFFANYKKINMPLLEIYNPGANTYNNPYTEDYALDNPPYFYCLST